MTLDDIQTFINLAENQIQWNFFVNIMEYDKPIC